MTQRPLSKVPRKSGEKCVLPPSCSLSFGPWLLSNLWKWLGAPPYYFPHMHRQKRIHIHIWATAKILHNGKKYSRHLFFFEIELGLGKTIIHSSNNNNICYIPQTWKTIIHSSKIDDLELYTKYWLWPISYRTTSYHIIWYNMCIFFII